MIATLSLLLPIATLVLVAAALVAGFLLRRRRPVEPWEHAVRRIGQAASLMQLENACAFSMALSEALRTYLERRYELPVSPLTTSELFERLSRAEGSPLGEHHGILRHFQNHCLRARQAGWRVARTDLFSMYETASRLVDETRPRGAPRFALLDRVLGAESGRPLRIPVTTGAPVVRWSSAVSSETPPEAAR